MIKNDRQYKLVKSTLRKFQKTLDHHDDLTKSEAPWVRKLHKATIAEEVKELKSQVAEYEALKLGTAQMPRLVVLKDIPRLLIQRRIALGWTQEDLAKRLGVRPQQVQSDEANDYKTASLSRLTKVAALLQNAKRKTRSVAVKRVS